MGPLYLAALATVAAMNNGVARTPPMGELIFKFHKNKDSIFIEFIDKESQAKI